MSHSADLERLIDAVRDAAARFRAALEQGSLRLHGLQNFPRGSCGDASELLGQYLQDSGLGTWDYRLGFEPESMNSHAWVEQGQVLADITADQFPDVSDPVVVTADRSWHDARFPSSPSSKIASLDWFHENRADAAADYDTLKRRADEIRSSSPT
jgi:hypothetical protein